jgi:hypothetical protein
VGFPSPIVPIYNHPASINMVKGERKVLVGDWLTCCRELRALPHKQYSKQIGSTLSIHGQRDSDIGGFPQYYLEDGVSYWGLIYEWSDEDIFNYIKLNNIVLPEQYIYAESKLEKYDNEDKSLSFDCWNCSASISSIKVDYLRVKDEMNRCKPAIDNLLEGEW